jgi:hypothetical protein
MQKSSFVFLTSKTFRFAQISDFASLDGKESCENTQMSSSARQNHVDVMISFAEQTKIKNVVWMKESL